MKRMLSSVLLVVFVLNILGYYGVFMGVRMQLAEQLREKFNTDNYAAADEVTFKIPLTMPYTPDAESFERVDGELVHNGETYRLVKQKFAKDTLHIVCIKDQHSQSIDKALTDYVKTFSDKSSSDKTPSKNLVSFSKDYFSQVIALESHYSGWSISLSWSQVSADKPTSVPASVLQPPQI